MPAKKKKPVIALLTDFGLSDNFVGVMKGVIACHCPQAAVIDITHSPPPHSILHASLALKGAYGYFPKGTVFLTVVDPGVGTDRRIIALKAEGMIFVAPDNGVLHPLSVESGSAALWEITWRPGRRETSTTFHGRDIFAPVAAMLASGEPLKSLGQRIKRIHTFQIPALSISDGRIRGEIIYIDNFGNLMTNISRDFLADGIRGAKPDNISIRIGRSRITGIARAYAHVDKGRAIAVFNSYEMLEVAVNQGSALKKFGAKTGDVITVVKTSNRRK